MRGDGDGILPLSISPFSDYQGREGGYGDTSYHDDDGDTRRGDHRWDITQITSVEEG